MTLLDHSPKVGELWEVEWVDSCASGRWESLKEKQEWAAKIMTMVHRTAGYVVLVDEKVFALAQSWGDFPDGDVSVNDVMAIPRVAVLSSRMIPPSPVEKGLAK